jgi:DtxR family Mn-dependent transcriptional regulator
MAALTESQQDYLETLLELSQQSQEIRSVDVATKLNVSRASVNKAMNLLKGEGLILQEKYGTVVLTEKGVAAAAIVRRRHDLLKRFLMETLGVSENVAEEDACRIEHDISTETLQKLQAFLDGKNTR